jgi:hypothetical protein
MDLVVFNYICIDTIKKSFKMKTLLPSLTMKMQSYKLVAENICCCK